MKHLRMTAALLMGLAVSACGASKAPYETATRDVPLTATELAPVQASFDVQSVRVTVPESLRVSEANRYYPSGDIVWREDPIGNRHAQVQAIVKEGILKGVHNMQGGTLPVMLDIQVTRFHALTEKARYTIGGVHAVQFHLLLRNPETGMPLGEPMFIKADLEAFGGQKAIRAEAQGLTQKVRITSHLAHVIQTQLTSPEGYKAANLGLMGAINQL